MNPHLANFLGAACATALGCAFFMVAVVLAYKMARDRERRELRRRQFEERLNEVIGPCR